MKQFFKNVAATIIGIFASGIIMMILGFICLMGMVLNGSSKPSLADNSVMVLKLQGQIDDRAEDNWLGQLTGDDKFNNLGMNNILSAIKKAKTEDKIKGIYLETGDLATDYATLQEIREALDDFKKKRQVGHCLWRQLFAGCLLPRFHRQQGVCKPRGTYRLAWHRFAVTIYKRCGSQVWRSLHRGKGGQIQEFHRNIYRG